MNLLSFLTIRNDKKESSLSESKKEILNHLKDKAEKD